MNQCSVVSDCFVKDIQEKLGLSPNYRYLYDITGKYINNIIEFDRSEKILLLSNIPDFFGKAHGRCSQESIDVLYQKINKISKTFNKKCFDFHPKIIQDEIDKLMNTKETHFSFEKIVKERFEPTVDKIVQMFVDGKTKEFELDDFDHDLCDFKEINDKKLGKQDKHENILQGDWIEGQDNFNIENVVNFEKIEMFRG